jgi:hypothetical protein
MEAYKKQASRAISARPSKSRHPAIWNLALPS